MKRFQEVMQEIRDQVEHASAGSSDRPTSLYQAGAVGREVKQSVAGPSDGSPMNVPPEGRNRQSEIRREVAAIRREIRSRPGAFRELLATPAALRSAIVISEVLGPPVSLRNDRR